MSYKAIPEATTLTLGITKYVPFDGLPRVKSIDDHSVIDTVVDPYS